MQRKRRDGDMPNEVTIQALTDVNSGDLYLAAPAGRARPEGWAMAVSVDRLERYVLEPKRNPIYLFAALRARYGQSSLIFAETGEAPSLAETRLSEAEHLALYALAGRVLSLALDAEMSPEQKAAALANALGFTAAGWSAFSEFEKDGRAHFAEHRRVQLQREGLRYEDARDAVGSTASRSKKNPGGKVSQRTSERLFARGKRRGARPFKDPTEPPG